MDLKLVRREPEVDWKWTGSGPEVDWKRTRCEPKVPEWGSANRQENVISIDSFYLAGSFQPLKKLLGYLD